MNPLKGELVFSNGRQKGWYAVIRDDDNPKPSGVSVIHATTTFKERRSAELEAMEWVRQHRPGRVIVFGS